MNKVEKKLNYQCVKNIRVLAEKTLDRTKIDDVWYMPFDEFRKNQREYIKELKNLEKKILNELKQ